MDTIGDTLNRYRVDYRRNFGRYFVLRPGVALKSAAAYRNNEIAWEGTNVSEAREECDRLNAQAFPSPGVAVRPSSPVVADGWERLFATDWPEEVLGTSRRAVTDFLVTVREESVTTVAIRYYLVDLDPDGAEAAWHQPGGQVIVVSREDLERMLAACR